MMHQSAQEFRFHFRCMMGIMIRQEECLKMDLPNEWW